MTNPLEGAYIPEARRIVTAQRLMNLASESLTSAKRSCASMMHSLGVKSFKFEAEGKRYRAKLERPLEKRGDPAKLYLLLSREDISLDDFLSCITIDLAKVAELLPQSMLTYVSYDYETGLDLTIREI